MSSEPKLVPLSPLQLKRHFFSVFSVHAIPGGTANGEVRIDPITTIKRLPTPANQWAIGLRLTLKSLKPEAPFFYDAEIEVQGLVEVAADYPADKHEQLASVNGLSLLYSSIRELLLIVTSRLAHGPVSLPTLSFAEFIAHKNMREKEQEKNKAMSSEDSSGQTAKPSEE